MARWLSAPLIALLLAGSTRAQTLPAVGEIEYEPFRQHVLTLLTDLGRLGSPLPPEEVTTLRNRLVPRPEDPPKVVEDARQLLDAYCLVGVHINPESRVKALRGPLRITLVRDQPVLVLVRVHNEGGVTHRLSVRGPQLVEKDRAEGERWLAAEIVPAGKPRDGLTGRPLEYRVLRLVARQSGKREATLMMDVGQGTQDLGFRAEVPILFTIRDK
jgi:hypothetical protein